MTTSFATSAQLDADLARTARHASYMRRGFYAVVLLVALAGQVSGAVEALHIPLVAAIPAVGALELGGIVVLNNADVRRRLGERAVASRILSAAIAAWAVAFNWLAHANHLAGGFFAGMSALGYAVWLMHTENQRRDRLRATGDLSQTTPAYELFGHWLRHPALTLHARSLARANPNLGLYDSLAAARAESSGARRSAAIAKVLHRKIRAVVDPTTADIAVAVYDLDTIAGRLAASADYDGLTALVGADLRPARLVSSDDDLIAQLEQAREAQAAALASAQAADAEAVRLTEEAATAVEALNAEVDRRAAIEAEVASALALAESEAQRRAAADARLDDLTAQIADLEQARQAAVGAMQQATDSYAAQERENDTLRARLAEAEAQVSRLIEEAEARASAAAKSSRPATKRQPNAAERIAKAIARSPKASDATIAARLSLSEATVRRHRRRQAVDSVSTDTSLTSMAA